MYIPGAEIDGNVSLTYGTQTWCDTILVVDEIQLCWRLVSQRQLC